MSVVRALQRVARSTPLLDTTLERGSPADLIQAIRDERLDAAVIPLPASVNGLKVMRVGHQHVVAAVRAGHSQANSEVIDLARLSPDRLLVLPREASRPLYDAIAAMCHSAGVSPTLVELPADELEQTLLAVASGTEIALLPASVVERYVAAGVRFLALAGAPPVIETGVVTPRNRDHLPAAAFLRALPGAAALRSAPVSPPDVAVAA